MRKIVLGFSAFLLLLSACGAAEPSLRPPRGNPDAAVLIEEFADFQCPACRAAHAQIVIPILQKYGNQVRWEHKHFPLRSLHRFALDAGEMSECMADQGKFWEFVDYAYEYQDDLSLEVLPAWVAAIGGKQAEAERCLKSHVKRGTVLADYKEGRDRGVGGTPTFFLNGARVESGFDTLSAAIDAALTGEGMKL